MRNLAHVPTEGVVSEGSLNAFHLLDAFIIELRYLYGVSNPYVTEFLLDLEAYLEDPEIDGDIFESQCKPSTPLVCRSCGTFSFDNLKLFFKDIPHFRSR